LLDAETTETLKWWCFL